MLRHKIIQSGSDHGTVYISCCHLVVTVPLSLFIHFIITSSLPPFLPSFFPFFPSLSLSFSLSLVEQLIDARS